MGISHMELSPSILNRYTRRCDESFDESMEIRLFGLHCAKIAAESAPVPQPISNQSRPLPASSQSRKRGAI
ncbi:MAG: hypothetical protein WBE89_17575 [Methyloceanibacter sp.]